MSVLRYVHVEADFACLWVSLLIVSRAADQVYGDQDMHSVVRNHTMDYMVRREVL